MISFLIVAWILFLIIKGVNKLKRQEEVAEEPAAPAPSAEEGLLTEIRDILARQKT